MKHKTNKKAQESVGKVPPIHKSPMPPPSPATASSAQISGRELFFQKRDALYDKMKEYDCKSLVPMPTPQLLKGLLQHGKLFDPTKLKVQKGATTNPNENACKLWATNEQLQLVTGYAWLGDGVWGQFSWGWDPLTGEIVETTEPKKKYFGAVLSDTAAFIAAVTNVPEFSDPSKYPPRMMKVSMSFALWRSV